MTDEKTKLTIRESLKLLLYGFRLIQKMTPAFLPLTALRSLITALQPLLVLFFTTRILSELVGARDINLIVTYILLTVGLSFIISILKSFLTRELNTYTAWDGLYDVLRLFEAERFTQMDFAYAEDANVSEILARMDTLARGSGTGLMNLFFYYSSMTENLFTLVAAILLLTVFSAGGIGSGPPVIALYGLLVIGLLVNLLYNRKERVKLEDIIAANANTNTTAFFYSEYVKSDQAAKDVRLYDQKEALLKIFRENFNAKPWIPFYFFKGRSQGFTLGILAALSGGFYLITGQSALNGTIPVGSIVQSVGAVTALAGAVGRLLYFGGRLWTNAPYIKPMREYITMPDLLVKGDRPVPAHEGNDYGIEFKNVSFRYPGAEGFALENLDLRLTPGERLAVVGLNGSGKTTMVKLLCRLYDPTEGEIRLNGIDIREYDYAEYISLFSVVFQDYMLFPLWLGQNVAAHGEYDEERVKNSLTGAGFADRLESMKDGLDTILYRSFDEDGTQISGGEAQKIALARALYKNAPVVVLDEPTAALDPIAEYEVYTTFDKTIGDRTAVFISHRLSSCRFCHRVAVFDEGRLIQLGSHEALLEDTDGRYHELWEAQASHYREGTEDWIASRGSQ